ncbi:MAG: cyclase, partial [Actinobacteria bacterium]|nr:cyclase [Actinomycetota bacterium]
RRHVMTQVIEHPDEVEGWRGVIEEGEVVKDHETAVREEKEDGPDGTGEHEPDEAGDEYEADHDYEPAEDDYEPAEEEDEPAEAADEYEPDEQDEAGEPEEAADEYEEPDEDRELAGAGRSGRRPRRR